MRSTDGPLRPVLDQRTSAASRIWPEAPALAETGYDGMDSKLPVEVPSRGRRLWSCRQVRQGALAGNADPLTGEKGLTGFLAA